MTAGAGVLVAAGTVCWTRSKGKVRVLVVHPAKRTDVGFPKGKVDPGESTQEAAVRETLEETGLAVTLGAPIGTAEYTMPAGRDKVVHYWASEVSSAVADTLDFTPNSEIARVEWLSLKAARAALSFELDRTMLDRLEDRLSAGTASTFALIALRHGRAIPASSWSGPDSTRPLEQVGLEQARSSARVIASYGPQKLISSTAARCVSTIEPVGRLAGLDVKATAAISQDAHEDGVADVGRIVAKRMHKRKTAVLCSHGPVLPDIISEVADATGTEFGRALRRASMLDVGSFTVLHVATADPLSGIVEVESFTPPML